MRTKSLIAKPMLITLKHLFKKPVTVQYPEERLVLAERYRGLHSLDMEICISCGKCVRACPNKCMRLTDAGFKMKKVGGEIKMLPKKHPEVYIGRCLFCGLCADACPTGALKMTQKYELAADDRASLFYSYYDLSEVIK